MAARQIEVGRHRETMTEAAFPFHGCEGVIDRVHMAFSAPETGGGAQVICSPLTLRFGVIIAMGECDRFARRLRQGEVVPAAWDAIPLLP